MLKAVLLIVAVLIIILSLLQSGKSEGIVSALTGQGSDLFSRSKERGAELKLSRATMILGILLFVVAIMINMG